MRILVTTISFALATTALAQFDELSGEPIPGQVIVHTFDLQAIDAIIDAIEQDTGTSETSIILSLPRLGLYTIQFPPPITEQEQEQIDQIFEDAASNDDIFWSEQNRELNAHGQTGSLWVSGVDINAASYQDQYALDILDTNGAHSYSQGQGVLSAVIDTGIDDTHPELLGKVSAFGLNLLEPGTPPTEWGNGIDDDGDGYIDEAVGHGTFISGLMTLVAPQVLILPIKVLNSDGIGNLDTIAAGIDYAVVRGAHVIVLALGTSGGAPQSLALAIDDAIDNGAVVISAVGNGGDPSCFYPASHPKVIAVGATDHLDELAAISNYSQEISVVAPGSSVVIDEVPVKEESVIGPLPDNAYAAGTGTSLSTGLTAGAAALIRAQGVDWPNATVPIHEIYQVITYNLRASTVLIQMPPGPMIEDKPRVELMTALPILPMVPRDGDINGDGYIHGMDLSILLGNWGELVPNGGLYRADIIRDETVGGADLAALLGSWSP